MKKSLAVLLSAVMMLGIVAGCSQTKTFDKSSEINVITREDGSGTRGAFMELFGIETIYPGAIVNNSTSVFLTSVADDTNAIGYVSLGALNDTVKAVSIDGVAASVENINNGTYKIVRPFNIVTKESLSDVAQDFVNYILSADGQAVVANKGYITVKSTAYTSTKPSGAIKIAGSSSVNPVMEKLAEAYKLVNPNATVEINMNDSSSGVKAAIDGTADIGMASRELKTSEIAGGVHATIIAWDGIAVIVNKNNTLTGLTSQNVKDIYTNAVKKWSDISGATWAE